MAKLPRSFPLALALVGACPAWSALAADAFSSDWSDSLKSSARLIAEAPSSGVLRAGVEVRLAPGAITYWRNPGDAGLPPTLSFDGSANLAQATVSYPAPRRLKEGTDEAFGYEGEAILPIDVEPLDPGRPVALALKLDYAVCEKICVPAQASLRLVLPTGAQTSPYAAALDKARAQAPRKAAWGDLGADLTSAGAHAWRLCLAAQAGPPRDVFIEAPETWWFESKPEAASPAGKDCFRIDLMQRPSAPAPTVETRLTITGGAGPVETTVALEPGASR